MVITVASIRALYVEACNRGKVFGVEGGHLQLMLSGCSRNETVEEAHPMTEVVALIEGEGGL